MQLELLPPDFTIKSAVKESRFGTFSDNMKLPIHRWFKYSAGFSAEWVERIISGHTTARKILDPFCGSGTTLVAAMKMGVSATGFESHPFVFRVAECKTNWQVNIDDFYFYAEKTLATAQKIKKETPCHVSELMGKCYSTENLVRLESLKYAYAEILQSPASDDIKNLIWLTITCILRECSCVGTAQWQYLLPDKKKANVSEPYAAFRKRSLMFCDDMKNAQKLDFMQSKLIRTDARNPDLEENFDLVITSPPYPNNYDYADATRLEMMFWGEISSWGDLHHAVRRHLIRSCSQHSAKDRISLEKILTEDVIDPIKNDLADVCYQLDEIRQHKGGKKTYHTMVGSYFIDLARVFHSLKKLTTNKAKLAFVIGDSAPYGIYVPVDEWLGKLAVAAGFGKFSFEKIRDRNNKWKNRKHTVPLKEGILWIGG